MLGASEAKGYRGDGDLTGGRDRQRRTEPPRRLTEQPPAQPQLANPQHHGARPPANERCDHRDRGQPDERQGRHGKRGEDRQTAGERPDVQRHDRKDHQTEAGDGKRSRNWWRDCFRHKANLIGECSFKNVLFRKALQQ